MKLPRKSVYALLLAIVCVNLMVRYPQTAHSVGVDSFSFAVLSSAIIADGRANWIIHPLSAFGLYPLSYPSGSFFITAGFAMSAGVSVEVATLVLSLFVAVFSVLAAFFMAREFSRNDLFAVAVPLFFSLMPKFVTNTLWEVPARGLFMSMTAIFLWAVLRAIKVRDARQIALAVVIFLLVSMFHRLAVLLVVVLIAFLLTMIFVVSMRIAKRRIPKVLLSPSLRARSRAIGLLLYGIVLVTLLFGSGVLEAYQEGALFSSGFAGGELANMGVSLGRSAGVLAPLALIGIPAVVFARAKGVGEYLLIASPLALIPTLFLRSYTGYYVATFFALFIGMGFVYLAMKLPEKHRITALVAAILLASAGASFAISYELPRVTSMTESEYAAGLYTKYRVQGTLACNNGLLGSRIASVSGGPYLPIGGATTPAEGPDALAFEFIQGFQVIPVPAQELTLDSDALFTSVGVTVGADWSVMFASYLDTRSERIAGRYGVSVICEDSSQDAVYYTGWGVTYESPLLSDVYASRYKIYEASGIRMWLAF